MDNKEQWEVTFTDGLVLHFPVNDFYQCEGDIVLECQDRMFGFKILTIKKTGPKLLLED